MKVPRIGVTLLPPSWIGGDKNPRWDDPPFATRRMGGIGIQLRNCDKSTSQIMYVCRDDYMYKYVQIIIYIYVYTHIHIRIYIYVYIIYIIHTHMYAISIVWICLKFLRTCEPVFLLPKIPLEAVFMPDPILFRGVGPVERAAAGFSSAHSV